MKHSFSSLFFGAFVALSFLGCAVQPAEDAESSGESEEALLGGVPSNYGFFVVTRRDFNKCASPMCGGWYVKRVNQATTACVDGSLQAECYVESISFKGMGLSTSEEEIFRGAVESGKALVRARTFKKRFHGRTLGTLKASEGWLGATGSTPAADATFVRAADNGIRCIQAPCPTTSAYSLNGTDAHNVLAVHLDQTATPADAESLDRAQQALGTSEGVLVAGNVLFPNCRQESTHCGPFVVAQEFYLRVNRREGRSCGARGSSFCNAGQYCSWTPQNICGAFDAAGSCAVRPTICTKIGLTVCGCDGNTYGNPCMAAASGTSVSSEGECGAVAIANP